MNYFEMPHRQIPYSIQRNRLRASRLLQVLFQIVSSLLLMQNDLSAHKFYFKSFKQPKGARRSNSRSIRNNNDARRSVGPVRNVYTPASAASAAVESTGGAVSIGEGSVSSATSAAA